jgi:putative component of toxin-antitoxin plasmid stabilization module
MIVVLLAGGDKDSQASDIALAKRQWRQYNA